MNIYQYPSVLKYMFLIPKSAHSVNDQVMEPRIVIETHWKTNYDAVVIVMEYSGERLVSKKLQPSAKRSRVPYV